MSRSILTSGFIALAGIALAQNVRADALLVSEVSEIMLPSYQQAALNRDLPARDIAFNDSDTLTILGSSSLWRWSFGDRSLQRLRLLSNQEGSSPDSLQRLGFDGVSQFAASSSTLFQISWSPKRVLRFDLGDQAESLGFTGAGDDFWVLRTSGLLKFDRDGKNLVQHAKSSRFNAKDPLYFDPTTHRVWYAHNSSIFHINLMDEPPTPSLSLKLKHRIIGLQGSANEIIAHTHSAVLRVSRSGKILRSIPVEGRRQLICMAITESAHAYLFDDHLVEIYTTKDQLTQRFRLPLEEQEQPTLIRLNNNLLAIIVNDKPRLFHLDAPSRRP